MFLDVLIELFFSTHRLPSILRLGGPKHSRVKYTSSRRDYSRHVRRCCHAATHQGVADQVNIKSKFTVEIFITELYQEKEIPTDLVVVI